MAIGTEFFIERLFIILRISHCNKCCIMEALTDIPEMYFADAADSQQCYSCFFHFLFFYQMKNYNPNDCKYNLLLRAHCFGLPIPGKTSCSTTIHPSYPLFSKNSFISLKSTEPFPSSQNTQFFTASKYSQLLSTDCSATC